MDPEGVATAHGINALAERIRERRDGTQAASVGPQRKPDGVYDVLTSCLECRKDGTLSCEDLAIHTSAITQAWNSIQPQLRAKKQPAYAIEWVIEPEYAKARKLAGL